MEYVITGGIATALFGAIIVNYQWGARRRDAIRGELMEKIDKLASVVEKLADSVQRHHEDAAAHAHTDGLLGKQEHESLCAARVNGLKEAITTLATNTEKGFNFLAGLIRNGGK